MSRSEGSRSCKVSQWQHLQLLEGNKRGNTETWSKSTNIAKFSIQHYFFVNNLSVYHWVCISYTRNINVCKYQISLSWWTRFQKISKLTEHFTFRNWWTTPPVDFHGLFKGGIFGFPAVWGFDVQKWWWLFRCLWADVLFYIWMTSTKMGVVSWKMGFKTIGNYISEITVFLQQKQRFAEDMCVCVSNGKRG